MKKIYQLQGLQKILDTLDTNEKKNALDRHLAHYNNLVKSETKATSISELATLKKNEAETLYVLMYIGEELGMPQSAVLNLVENGHTIQ